MLSENKQIRWNTTTTGKCRDGKPPDGIELSLLGELMGLSLHTPFARDGLELADREPTAPFSTDLEASTFISHTFFTFFSWICSELG